LSTYAITPHPHVVATAKLGGVQTHQKGGEELAKISRALTHGLVVIHRVLRHFFAREGCRAARQQLGQVLVVLAQQRVAILDGVHALVADAQAERKLDVLLPLAVQLRVDACAQRPPPSQYPERSRRTADMAAPFVCSPIIGGSSTSALAPPPELGVDSGSCSAAGSGCGSGSAAGSCPAAPSSGGVPSGGRVPSAPASIETRQRFLPQLEKPEKPLPGSLQLHRLPNWLAPGVNY